DDLVTGVQTCALPICPAVMPVGKLAGVGIGNSLRLPPVVMRPMLPTSCSVNQSAPSDPAVISSGPLSGVGTSNSVKLPPVVMRPDRTSVVQGKRGKAR